MTPKQMIRKAKSAHVVFDVADAPGDVWIDISKAEAVRLVDAHDLPADDTDHPVGTVSVHDDFVLITFHT